MEKDVSILFRNCNIALDSGNATLAHSILEQVYSLLLNYPSKNILWAYYNINLASVFNNMGRFTECRDCCLNAEKIIPIKGNEDLKAKVESTLASCYLNIGDFPFASEHVIKAISLYNKINKIGNVALELIVYGDILLRTGEWEQSIKNYSEALSIAKKLKNKRLESQALMALGFVFRGHRFLYLAIDHYREAERICKQLNFNQGLVMALYERANTYLSLKMPEKTSVLVEQIESLTPSDSPMRSFLLKLQYCIHNQNRNAPEAMSCANLLLEFFQKSDDKRGEAESLEMIGSSYYNQLEMDKARYFGEKGLVIAEEIGDTILQSTCKQLICDVDYVILNNIDLNEIRRNEDYDQR